MIESRFITIGRLSRAIGAILIVRLPFLFFVLSGGLETVSSTMRQILIGAYILLGNQHWGDNIGVLKALVIDVPLAAMLFASGARTARLERSGRRLALVYAGIVLILEIFGFTSVALPQMRSSPGLDQATVLQVTASFIAKLVYPVFLLVFYSLPGVKRQFSSAEA